MLNFLTKTVYVEADVILNNVDQKEVQVSLYVGRKFSMPQTGILDELCSIYPLLANLYINYNHWKTVTIKNRELLETNKVSLKYSRGFSSYAKMVLHLFQLEKTSFTSITNEFKDR